MVIETFVFLDFEATGVPEREQNRTKATELTLLAVSRCDIINTVSGSLPPLKKLSFRCNPQRKITTEAATLTGLTNDLLEHEPLFKDKIECINEFLADLTQPVCLVAHSGEKLDFTLLRAEYNDAKAKLPSNLLCVDSFKAFKSLSYAGHFKLNGLSLKKLYKTFLGKEPRDCHDSENDCLMLLECVIAHKQSFLKWADNNCKAINKVKSMRGS